MGTELACQRSKCRGEEYRNLAMHIIQAVTHEHSCIRGNSFRIQLCEGVLYVVQWDSGQQTITQ